MKFINIGFGNMVAVDRIVALVSSDSAPIKRLIQDAKDEGRTIDVTCGRRTRAVIITDSEHVILSAIQAETIANRLDNDTLEDDGDEESFEVSFVDGKPILVDQFGNEIKLEPSNEEVEIFDSAALAAALIGYWLDEAAGNNESFTFNAEERGIYTWKDETYEFSYTLSGSESILDIRYDDGDKATFYVEIDGDTMVLDTDWILIRQ